MEAPFHSATEALPDNRRSAPAASSALDKPRGRKRYLGPIAHLRGKTALVEPRVEATGQVMAQFEEPHWQEARGWWEFSVADFETLNPSGGTANAVDPRLLRLWSEIGTIPGIPSETV